jgi:putative endonuclease
MFHTYILRSVKIGKFYIGSTADLAKRVERHNRGDSIYTKNYRPFELVRSEAYNTRAEAVRREREIKNWKSSIMIERLIAGIG